MIVHIECDSPNVVFGQSPCPVKVVVELTKDGIDGKSAYQIAKENGYPGTEAEFAQMLLSIDKKEDRLNFWTLIHGASQRELLSNNTQGKKYRYTYGTTVLFRFITADKTDDSFFNDENLTNKIATKRVEITL